MPPVHEPDAVHGVQHHLQPAVLHPPPPTARWRVLEEKPHAVMPHVRAHVDGELEGGRQREVGQVAVAILMSGK